MEENYVNQKLMTHLDQKRSPISYTKQDKHAKDLNSHLTFALGSTENQRGRP